MNRHLTSVGLVVAAGLCVAAPAAGQDPEAEDSTAVEIAGPKSGAEFLIPFGSLVIPGLGQYIHGAVGPGLGYTGTALAGLAIWGSSGVSFLDELPRDAETQRGFLGAQLFATAGYVSAWDAFHRSIPALQQVGKYTFLSDQAESLGDILSAPFDVRFAGRWTTWIDLAFTGLVTGIVLSTRESGTEYVPLRQRDIGFATAVSFNAAVGEEALFRGWVLPALYQSTGNFWVANVLQAGLFGAGHIDQAEEFALVIGTWALYEGWLTRRNNWSIRESIFHHFWYDVFVITATFLADERASAAVHLPTIRF